MSALSIRSQRATPRSSYPLKPRPAFVFTDSPDHAELTQAHMQQSSNCREDNVSISNIPNHNPHQNKIYCHRGMLYATVFVLLLLKHYAALADLLT